MRLKTEVVKYKRPISIFKKYGCFFKLKFDSVLGGECHGCRYCYRLPLFNKFDDNSVGCDKKKYADLNYLIGIFQDASTPFLQFGKESRTQSENEIIQYIKQKMPIRFGSMCDPFDPDIQVREITSAAIDLMNVHDHPYMVFTKSDYCAAPQIIEKLKLSGKNVLVHVSLSNLDPFNDFVLEPKSPSAKERLKAIEALIKENVPVVLRIGPIILGVNDQDVTGLIHKYYTMGGKKVIIEELRASDDLRSFLALNYPSSVQFFEKEMKWNYYRYPWKTIFPVFKDIVISAKKLNLEIGICGNHIFEKKLCDNDNCCLFDNPKAKFEG